ncbi:MAG: S41 family peptidase [Alistipes senegalensis]|nr:S41 family peptidase [Bacteroides cellulosilyticus]MCM1352091.1 S41 family peptidase [Alistipes senegalensis]
MKKNRFLLLALSVSLGASLCAGCGKDTTDSPTPPPDKGEYKRVNEWMFAYMKTHYLWNEAVQQVTPDYKLGYEDFLDDVLEKVAAQKDENGRPVNYDDGYATANNEWHFYSNVQRYKKSSSKSVVTRGTREQAEGLGIEMLFYTPLNEAETEYAFLVAAVAPGSPAAEKGLKRGDLISRVDGSAITGTASINAGWEKLMLTESGMVRMTLYDPNTGAADREISVKAASYADNPVWKSKTVFTANGKKVGYLCYGSFNYNYDNELIEAFKQFREESIQELVIDLRYNGGGHVVSSAVLGTLVAGEAHKGEVYARTAYNASRASETPDIYKLGEAQYNAKSSGYRHDPIATAVSAAVGLPHIYVLCTGNTASASELLINGLRGVGVEVRLIGETTNGKNVGMEPKTKTFGDYEYEFSPITFYIANGKGENDYGDGFVPDVEVGQEDFLYKNSDGKIVGTDWGDEEHETLFRLALQWIEYGSKPMPDYPQAVATRGCEPLRFRSLAPVRVQEMLLPR